jgi:sigma-E factor negative regulatory protein RseC
MIEESAMVVEVCEGAVIIESSRTSACAQCQVSDSCGQKALSEWASSKLIRLEVENPSNLSVRQGDSVVVGIDEGSFVVASALVYLLPIFSMMLAGIAVFLFNGPEWASILVSFIGLVSGFFIVKLMGKRLERRCQYKPVLLRTSS